MFNYLTYEPVCSANMCVKFSIPIKGIAGCCTMCVCACVRACMRVCVRAGGRVKHADGPDKIAASEHEHVLFSLRIIYRPLLTN